jgi:hypothetical protein
MSQLATCNRDIERRHRSQGRRKIAQRGKYRCLAWRTSLPHQAITSLSKLLRSGLGEVRTTQLLNSALIRPYEAVRRNLRVWVSGEVYKFLGGDLWRFLGAWLQTTAIRDAGTRLIRENVSWKHDFPAIDVAISPVAVHSGAATSSLQCCSLPFPLSNAYSLPFRSLLSSTLHLVFRKSFLFPPATILHPLRTLTIRLAV